MISARTIRCFLPALLLLPGDSLHAQQSARRANQNSTAAAPSGSFASALSPAKWLQVETAVDRALAWIAAQQAPNGSFPTAPQGQPAVTSLCVLVFLSRGHQPGLGPYGQQIEKGIDFVISTQMPDGLFSYQPPQATFVTYGASHAAAYNHAVAGLMLGEVFGHVTGRRMKDVKSAMESALQFTRALQTRPKQYPQDRGGWRYLRLRFDHNAADSDLSVTSWQIMFLRSARNAEFNVPGKYIDEAMDYVHRSWNERTHLFNYAQSEGMEDYYSRGMMGAGILTLSLAGQHQTPMALSAGEWLLAHPFNRFGEQIGQFDDHFFYSMYYCSQAAAQLGGRYWEGIFPPIVKMLLTTQSPDGGWPLEPNGDRVYGNVYTTALAVLTLTPAYQLLPVYQR